MGHSPEYQTELYIKQLEQMVKTLLDQAEKFREGGLDELADATLDKSEQLKRAIVQLRKVMEE
ncbi:hypothetical protein [Pseudomonas fluorescens]|uniref:hypothetical protein n=1 Tax=Pseudomonas fluorescens TaxID=294 RepID=UPI000F47C26F|nr:hypothetical protein [Pseudomonas fluorescens]RON86785.1 hypothetical protein BK668_18680 [Pseudomonas fluorescens]